MAPVDDHLDEQHEVRARSNRPNRRPRSRFRNYFVPYVPPARAARTQVLANDHERNMLKQQQAWTLLKKRINGVINRINSTNIRDCTFDLLRLNIIRGKGLFCKSLMRAQLASIHFSSVYASLVSVLNTRIPEVTELLLRRLIVQLKKGYAEREKHLCSASLSFLAHLFTQQVIDELPLLEFLSACLMNPSNSSTELAVLVLQECGHFMTEKSPQGTEMVYSRLREILHNSRVDYRTQVLVDNVMELRRKRADVAAMLPPELDLVEEEDVIQHNVSLDDANEADENLNIFSFDKHFDENESKYSVVLDILLGDQVSISSAKTEMDRNPSHPEPVQVLPDSSTEKQVAQPKNVDVPDDKGETDLVDFRRLVYLKIMSAASFEECAHKLLKFMKTRRGMESELCNMVIECCSQEKSFLRYYGLLGQRLCLISTAYTASFEEQFARIYASIHRYDTRKIRNISTLFAFLLSNGALNWALMSVVRLVEEETTASSRIFLKILFREMAKAVGDKRMREFFRGENLAVAFPYEDAKSIRFAINFFVQIELGFVTEELRELLRKIPKKPPVHQMEARAEEGDDASSLSSSSLSSSCLSSSSGFSREDETVNKVIPKRVADAGDSDAYRASKMRKYH